MRISTVSRTRFASQSSQHKMNFRGPSRISMFVPIKCQFWICVVLIVAVLTVEAQEAPEVWTCPHNQVPMVRQVRRFGKSHDLVYYWHDEPSRAAASLLLTAAAAAGYTNLSLEKASADICHNLSSSYIFKRYAVAPMRSITTAGDEFCQQRMTAVGFAEGYSALQLHLRLETKYSLAHFFRYFEHICSILDRNETKEDMLTVYVLQADHEDVVRRCFNNSVRVQHITRSQLGNKLQNTSHATFFVDYNLWTEEPVESIPLPPYCYSGTFAAVRAIDIYTRAFAKDIKASLEKFTPDGKHIREVLERAETHGGDVLQAATEWSQINNVTFQKWIPNYRHSYLIGALVCNATEYAALFADLQTLNKPSDYDIKVANYSLNCTSRKHLLDRVNDFVGSVYYAQNTLVGIITDFGSTEEAINITKNKNIPFITIRDSEGLNEGTRVAGGSMAHTARALRGLLDLAGWTRLTLVTDTAHAMNVMQNHLAGLNVKYIDASKMPTAAKQHLEELKQQDPRIIILCIEPLQTAFWLRVAASLEMADCGITWMSCGEPHPSATPHFTLHFWSSTFNETAYSNSSTVNMGLRALVLRHWAPHSVQLADAFQTISWGFHQFYCNNPHYRSDPYAKNAVSLFWEGYDSSPASGFNGQLIYEMGALQDVSVFLEWCNNSACRLVNRWYRGNWSRRPLLGDVFDELPSDGSHYCFLSAGDPFYPSCHMYDLLAIPLLLLLLSSTVYYAHRKYQTKMLERETKIRMQLQHWMDRVAGSLAGYLVDRDLIQVQGELGKGHFGCVYFAILRDHTNRAVAVKALKEGAAAAEESEFLREASTLASLEHDNIVKFIGVCAGDGPPLLLMEHAFFGDLLKYLRTRRHLVEEAAVEGEDTVSEQYLGWKEAEHVSAVALTRLALEAASALSYLASRGIIHRDVRASNCLVDARRTLKLSDFGLARQIGGDEGVVGGEYECRRRGFFPVPWMAPESLERGVFSFASDVWSFGVLALELVTLGARPYGDKSPFCVLHYVRNGGQPPLPLDATPHTRGLMMLCWRRRAEQRPSAAELVNYLKTNSRALRPALWTQVDFESADSDSAFGESPCHEHDEPFTFASSPRSLPQ